MTLTINSSESTLPLNASTLNQNEGILNTNKVSYISNKTKESKNKQINNKINFWLIVGTAALGSLTILAATVLSGGTAPTLIVVTLGLFQTILSIGLLTQKIALKSMELRKTQD